MRAAFIDTLMAMAAEDERLWLLTGDLGFSVLEPFADRFPNRFVNAGVAEQNMTGVAAGIALTGQIVFTYSIANFPTLRCFEQIRNDACYHNLPVKVVAVGGGMAYGSQGYTHHGIEDLAVMRTLPNLMVVAPGDPVEVRLATQAVIAWPGPAYLRLGRGGEPVVHGAAPAFAPGKMIEVRPGCDALIISTGALLSEAVAAAKLAEADGRSVAVWSSPWIKPFDRAAVERAAAAFPIILTAEEARVSGGLGGLVAEALAVLPSPRARLLCAGIPDLILTEAYSQKAVRTLLGLDAQGLYTALYGISRNP
jgi:transketolase